MKRFVKEFCSKAKTSNIEVNKDMTTFNTFKIKCKAKVFITINSYSDLTLLYYLLDKYKLKSFCVGAGSKVLFCQKNINMIIFKLGDSFCKIEKIGGSVLAGGGVSMGALCSYCNKNNLSCVEWGLGIPCTIGGGVYMNAGCYGKSFSDIVIKVFYTDGKRIYSLEGESCEFGYRKSFFQNKNYVILYVLLKTSKKANIKKITQDNFAIKVNSQPYALPSCGSVFRSSILPAPVFIEGCGLKGLKIGGAEVSKKHCGFIVNKKNATSKQVLKIIYKIKKTVLQKSAIILDNEIILLGEKHGIFWRLSHPYYM